MAKITVEAGRVKVGEDLKEHGELPLKQHGVLTPIHRCFERGWGAEKGGILPV